MWLYRNSNLGEIHTGITSTIILLSPLYIVVIERIWFKTTMSFSNLMAFFILIISSIFISLGKEMEVKIYGIDVAKA